MNNKSIKLALWSGFAFLPLYAIGFVLIARFIPPPAPTLTPEELATFLFARRSMVSLGMLIAVVASPLLIAWSVALFSQMKRIETGFAVLGYFQLLNGAVLSAFFMIPPIIWATLVYREGQPLQSIQMLSDFAWFAWIISWPFAAFQQISLAICGLSDRSARPIFPRWLCYMSIFAALSLIPASLVIFVKSGPFAWNGILAIYLPLCIYVIWYTSVTIAISKGID